MSVPRLETECPVHGEDAVNNYRTCHWCKFKQGLQILRRVELDDNARREYEDFLMIYEEQKSLDKRLRKIEDALGLKGENG